MEDSRKRAFIKQQAVAKKKLEDSLPPKVTGQANPSTKRKLSEKADHPPKKPKVVTRSIVGETPTTSKLPPKPGPGKGKDLMTSQGLVTMKPPILLRKDSQYALKQISSIIKDEDYEDLGNHATKVMVEMSLFSLAQVHICPLFFYPSCCLFLSLTLVFDSCKRCL